MSKRTRASIGEPTLKKFVIDLRYKPNLRVYERMDLVGIALSNEFPDWERGPLALEIRNTKKHRRLHIQFRRSVFDCINPADDDKEIDLAKKAVKKVSDEVSIAKFDRFAVRCWFVADSRASYETLVDLVYGKFCTPLGGLDAFSKYKLKDAAYAVDLTRDEWTYGVRVGPMTRDEWFSTVYHERKAFETDADGETFAKYANTLPDRFVYIDVDVWREEVFDHEAYQAIPRLRSRTQGVIEGILQYLRS